MTYYKTDLKVPYFTNFQILLSDFLKSFETTLPN